MKKFSTIFVVLVVLLSLPMAASVQQRHGIDYSKPLYAEDVKIGYKMTVDYIPRAAGFRGGQGGGTSVTTTATGILGAPVEGEKYAIVIGIADYPGTSSDLQYTDDDAQLVYDTLINVYGFKPENIILLLNMDASFYNIYNAVMELKSKVQPGDEVVFYFSGHGSNGRAEDGDDEIIDEALVTHDGNPDGSFILIWDGQLKAWFEDFPTDRIIFIFDSCYSGGMTDLAAEGRIVVMASGEREFSLESSEWQHGQFTYYFFLEGINYGYADVYDHDGDPTTPDVTVEEAFDYTLANCEQQTPVIVDGFTNDLLP
ncbi:polysaccharide deacetylase [Thermococcus onnurineus NA1]|uniref:Polysaccharide deacetylase n=1 Tax=Thermococcus onnurineus (strain NA1) TaxID=523850 RepID=B6YX88_THEON|nr:MULTISPECIES: caspase family protein [Thermococcus]ACJ16701.1 polysaccharide deacetylase [Thermococcus onnurineus NA1]NJE46944.1 caspase family protein [Thermococcus sp. GR7]NJE78441.1 caspase family protein [Thermococcus sp. GR4]NJF23262.1 caspase family protein [Thermococcus sp. GR5]